jgi:uncharacterized Zn-binding protein involved in type VI secretion
MGQPAATMGDKIMATDIHIILIPAPPGAPIPTPLPHPFVGTIDTGCATNVMIGGKPAAVMGAGATNTPPHIPQGGPFQIPPTNRATIIKGSATVMIGGKPAARMGDTAMTCNDPAPLPVGAVMGTGVTVLIGG